MSLKLAWNVFWASLLQLQATACADGRVRAFADQEWADPRMHGMQRYRWLEYWFLDSDRTVDFKGFLVTLKHELRCFNSRFKSWVHSVGHHFVWFFNIFPTTWDTFWRTLIGPVMTRPRCLTNKHSTLGWQSFVRKRVFCVSCQIAQIPGWQLIAGMTPKREAQRPSVMWILPHVCPSRTLWHPYHFFPSVRGLFKNLVKRCHIAATPSGGVTREGVVLSDLQSIDC